MHKDSKTGPCRQVHRANVIMVTVCRGWACHNRIMNFIRIALLVVAVLLVPGGMILLVPLVNKWLQQRKSLTPERAEAGPS